MGLAVTSTVFVSSLCSALLALGCGTAAPTAPPPAPIAVPQTAPDRVPIAAADPASQGLAPAVATLPGISWVLTAGGPECDAAEDVALDAAGTAIVVGQFQGQVVLGDEVLDSAGGADVFVVAIGPGGRVRWARRFGGPGDDLAVSVAVTSAGEALVLGSATGEIELGDAVVGGPRSEAGFLAQLDSGGEVQWARGFGATIWDLPWEVAVDDDDRPIAVGAFRGELAVGDRRASSQGEADAYAIRFTREGALDYLHVLSGEGWVHAAAVAPVGGDVLVAGTFSKRAELGATLLESAGAADVFVARLGADGVLWARRYGGTGADAARALAIAPDGGALVGGSFTGRADFGTELESAGKSDGFVVRTSGEGEPGWARRVGGAQADDVRALGTGPGGRAWAAVRFADALEHDGDQLIARRASDLILLAYGPAGEAGGAWQVGGAGPMLGSRGLAARDGAVVVAGSFAGTASAGPARAESEGVCDILILRFDAGGNQRHPR